MLWIGQVWQRRTNWNFVPVFSRLILHELLWQQASRSCYIYYMYLCVFFTIYQKPGSLRVLHSIFAVLPGIYWSPTPGLGVAVPDAPLTSGTTLDLTFYISSSCCFRPWYFHAPSFWGCCQLLLPHLSHLLHLVNHHCVWSISQQLLVLLELKIP